jgi:hypothetical protein
MSLEKSTGTGDVELALGPPDLEEQPSSGSALNGKPQAMYR